MIKSLGLRRGRDDGYAAITVVWLALILAVLAAVAGSITGAIALRHAAGAAADLAALAAADQVLAGERSACAGAARIAARNGAAMTACHLTGEVADVVVRVEPPGVLRLAGPVIARARAEPTSPD